MPRIHIFLEDEELAILDGDMKSRSYRNRSRFFRDLLQGNLKPQKGAKAAQGTAAYLLEQNPWLEAFYKATGRYLQKDLMQNALAAERIHGAVKEARLSIPAAKEGLPWLLKVVAHIRSNKYAGRQLLMAVSSYVQIEKKLDDILDYALQKKAQQENGKHVHMSPAAAKALQKAKASL